MKTGLAPCEAARRAKPPWNRHIRQGARNAARGNHSPDVPEVRLILPSATGHGCGEEKPAQAFPGSGSPLRSASQSWLHPAMPMLQGLPFRECTSSPTGKWHKRPEADPGPLGSGCIPREAESRCMAPMYKAVGLQLLQRVGEHRVGDGRKHLLQFAKPHR